jgi:hypothetical protein
MDGHVLATRVKVSPRSFPEVTNQDQPDSREGSLSALCSYSADRCLLTSSLAEIRGYLSFERTQF